MVNLVNFILGGYELVILSSSKIDVRFFSQKLFVGFVEQQIIKQ